jgi:hypothetical protein
MVNKIPITLVVLNCCFPDVFEICSTHIHVDLDGHVYHPYLQCWTSSSNIQDLCTGLKTSFELFSPLCKLGAKKMEHVSDLSAYQSGESPPIANDMTAQLPDGFTKDRDIYDAIVKAYNGKVPTKKDFLDEIHDENSSLKEMLYEEIPLFKFSKLEKLVQEAVVSTTPPGLPTTMPDQGAIERFCYLVSDTFRTNEECKGNQLSPIEVSNLCKPSVICLSDYFSPGCTLTLDRDGHTAVPLYTTSLKHIKLRYLIAVTPLAHHIVVSITLSEDGQVEAKSPVDSDDSASLVEQQIAGVVEDFAENELCGAIARYDNHMRRSIPWVITLHHSPNLPGTVIVQNCAMRIRHVLSRPDIIPFLYPPASQVGKFNKL